MSISAIIDIGIVLIILVSAGVSFFRGFVREVLTIFGTIGGGFAAYMFGGKLAPVFAGWLGVVDGEKPKKLFDLIPYNIVADICAYVGIFLAVFLILQLISYFMSASVKAIGLGPVDRALGVVFGIARALLFLGVVYLVLGGLIPNDNKEEILGKSKTIVYVEAVSNWLKGFLPADTDVKVKDGTAEKAEDAAKDKLNDLRNMGQDAADKVGEKAGELKDNMQEKSKDLPAYSPETRNKLDNLIEKQESDDPALPERTAPHE